jgi:hypothetical protein
MRRNPPSGGFLFALGSGERQATVVVAIAIAIAIAVAVAVAVPPFEKGGKGGFAFAIPRTRQAKANPPRHQRRARHQLSPGVRPLFQRGQWLRA